MSQLYHTYKDLAYKFLQKYKDPLYKLYDKYKDRDFIFIIPFVLLSLNVRISHFFYLLRPDKGLPQSEDAQWYIDYANALMASGKIGLHMNDILYFGYNILLTLLLAIFKDPKAVIFIQAVTAGLSVILVYKIARMLFNKTTAIIASYFYYDKYDITLWSMYILSDSFFISLLLLCIYFLILAIESDKSVYKTLFIATSLYMLVFRPTGAVSLIFILLYILIRLDRKLLMDFIRKRGLAIGAVLVTGAAAFGYLLAGGKLDPLITSMQFNAKKVLYNIYANGWIYDKPSTHDYHFRPDYDIDICNSLIISFIVNNWDHIFTLYIRRSIAFLGSWVWKTDLHSARGLIRLAENLLPTLLFAVGTIVSVVNGTFRRSSIIWMMVLTVFVFCIVFFIDAMYRYKAPGMPFIIIAAAYGAERIIYGLRIIANKYAGMLLWDKKKHAEKH